MAEFSLEGWTATERDSLAFLLDDAEITVLWGPNEIEVPDESAARVQRFVDFLNDKHDASIEADEAPLPVGNWDFAGPGLGLADTRYFDVASPWLRFGGYFVDGLILAPLAVLFYAADGTVFSSWWWLHVALVATYRIAMIGLLGRTLGNMVVRTRVVTEADRSIPGVQAGFLRWAVPESVPLLVLALTPVLTGLDLVWALIVYVPVLKGPSHRGLHDRAAGVMVLDDRLAPVRPRPTPSRDVV